MTKLLSRLIQTNGIYLNTLTLGEGPLIVFCHGFPGHWSNWRQQLDTISALGFCCIAVDMRGYGKSSRPDSVEDYNMDQQVGDMCGLLDALGINKAIFVGQDFGAALVWNMALREPARVAGVVGISVLFDHDYYGRSCMGHLPKASLTQEFTDNLLVASPMNPPSYGFKTIAAHQFLHAHYFQQQGVADTELGHNAREFLCRIYWGLSAKGHLGDWANYPSSNTTYLDVLPEAPPLPWPWMSAEDMDIIEAAFLRAGTNKAFTGGLASYRVADQNWYIGEKYCTKNVKVPALFIAGEADPVIASVNSTTLQRVKQRVPDLRGTKIIANAGHFVQLEKPDEVSAAIFHFITGLTTQF